MADGLTALIPQEQLDIRADFGVIMKGWFKWNRWSQEVPHAFAQQRKLNGPWGSQISLLMNGRMDPKPQFFMSLAEFNRAVADRDYAGLDLKLINRLENAEPFLTVDDRVANGKDFFGMMTGFDKWPDKFLEAPKLSPGDAAAVGRAMDKAIDQLMLDRIESRGELWRTLLEEMRRDDAEMAAVKKWLVGQTVWTPELQADYGALMQETLKALKQMG